MADKTLACPKCQSIEVVPFVYEYPNKELLDKQKKGLMVIGGCWVTGRYIATDSDPKNYCKKCGNEW